MTTRLAIPLAFALAALSGAASAQTSGVVLYGIVDTGLEYLTNASRTGTTDNHVIRMAAGNLSGSRWGLRGVEDLGGGLKAIMRLENGFESDTGVLAQGGRLFGRHAWVGLQGPFGSVTFGRQQNVFYDLMLGYDPMGFTRYSALMHDTAFTGRADNAVKYTGNFSGVTTLAYYSLGRNNDGEVPGNPKVAREFGAGANYTAGKFGVGAAFSQFHGNTIPTQDQAAKRLLLGANYVFDRVTVFAAYRWLKDEIVAAGTPVVRSNLAWTGLSYQATPALKLTGVAYYTKFMGPDGDPLSIVLNAGYNLSKRTDLYANIGFVKNRDGSALGLNGYRTAIIPGENQTGLMVGVRHQF